MSTKHWAIMDVQLTAFSLPMFATWVYVHPFRLLIDAGDGVTALMGPKIHAIDTVAITHAHRDHLAGLPQLLNMRSAEGQLQVVHPAHSRSLAELRDFAQRFDTVINGRVTWYPAQRRDQTELSLRNCWLRNFPVRHIREPDTHRSRTLGYHIIESKRKLRPEMVGLPQAELDAIRLARGQDAIVAPIEEKVLSASGDTLPLDPAEYRGTQVLLHECTFLRPDDRDEGGEEGRDHWHSTLPEVLTLAREAQVGALVLYHISQRYAHAEITETVSRAVRHSRLACPVYVIYPGRLNRDVLAETVEARSRRRSGERRPAATEDEPSPITADDS